MEDEAASHDFGGRLEGVNGGKNHSGKGRKREISLRGSVHFSVAVAWTSSPHPRNRYVEKGNNGRRENKGL